MFYGEKELNFWIRKKENHVLDLVRPLGWAGSGSGARAPHF